MTLPINPPFADGSLAVLKIPSGGDWQYELNGMAFVVWFSKTESSRVAIQKGNHLIGISALLSSLQQLEANRVVLDNSHRRFKQS